jgi:hypothetical protein
LTACGFNLFTQISVFCCIELKPVEVRTPKQTPNIDPSLGCGGKDRADFTSGTVELFITIAAPIGKHEQITFTHGFDCDKQFSKVNGTMNEHSDLIPS